MNRTTLPIPEDCGSVTIEKDERQVVVTFSPKPTVWVSPPFEPEEGAEVWAYDLLRDGFKSYYYYPHALPFLKPMLEQGLLYPSRDGAERFRDVLCRKLSEGTEEI